MKICIFTNHFYPEDFKINDIAFELNTKGYDVTVLTAIPDYPQGKYYKGYSLFRKRKEVVNGVKVYRIPIIPRGKGKSLNLILNYISYFICLLIFTIFHSLIYSYDKIFVHLTSPFFVSLPAVYLKKVKKIPIIFWVLDLWPESLISAGGIRNKWFINSQKKIVSYVYKNCEKILISSKGFKKSICEKGNFEDKLEYFPNWSDVVLQNNIDENIINTIYPFSDKTDKDFFILFAGNMGESQNLGKVMLAALELKKYKNIKFIFLGDGRKKKELFDFVQENRLLDTVFFPGRFPVDKMSSFMSKADILLVSLKDEFCFNLTVPAKLQFYMAQGQPILGFMNGDGAELIYDAQCGFTVPANDYKQLALKILEIEKMDKKKLKDIGVQGKEYYQKYFSKSFRIDQLLNLLNNEI